MTPTAAARVFHADVVLPGDDAAVLDGAVVVDATGTVVDVGPAQRILPRHTGAHVERVVGAVTPGLVNAHTHLELSALRDAVPGGDGFLHWVDRLMDRRAATRPEEDGRAIEAAVEEMREAGTSAVGEVSNTLAALPALVRSSTAGCVFHEVVGLDPERALAVLEHARIDERAAAAGADALDLAIAPGAHTLYTTHPSAVRAALELARQRGQRTSLHLAEHGAERTFLETGAGPFAEWTRRRGFDTSRFPVFGKGPVQAAAELGLLAPDVLLVHLTDIRDGEMALVAESRAPVVLCPRSNWFIERRLPPVRAWLQAGVVPALGTDSLASNTSLDVLAEAAWLAHAWPELPARTLLEMATAAGARALGRSDLGRIAVGTRPGVIAFEGRVEGDPFAWVLRQSPSARRWCARRYVAS